MTFGFRYIFQRRSLLGLQLVFFVGNFFASIALGLLAPMILARSGNNEQTYGIVQAMVGIGGYLTPVVREAEIRLPDHVS